MRIINENPNGKVLGYICYTDDELSERAYHQLMAFECDSIYVDKEFVSVESLEELKKILSKIKNGDSVLIFGLASLSPTDALRIIELIENSGATALTFALL